MPFDPNEYLASVGVQETPAFDPNAYLMEVEQLQQPETPVAIGLPPVEGWKPPMDTGAVPEQPIVSPIPQPVAPPPGYVPQEGEAVYRPTSAGVVPRVQQPMEPAVQVKPVGAGVKLQPLKTFAGGVGDITASHLQAFATSKLAQATLGPDEELDPGQKEMLEQGRELAASGKKRGEMSSTEKLYYDYYKGRVATKEIDQTTQAQGKFLQSVSDAISDLTPKETKMTVEEASLWLSPENPDLASARPENLAKTAAAGATVALNSLPYTMESLGASLVGGAAGVAAGTAYGGPPGAAIAGPVAAFTAGSIPMAHAEKGNWIKEARGNGIDDPQILNELGGYYGLLSGITEQAGQEILLAPVKAFIKGGPAKGLAKTILGKASAKAVAKALAIEVAKVLGTGVSGGMEEAIQGAESNWLTGIAFKRMAEKYPERAEEIAESATKWAANKPSLLQQFIAGGMAEMLMGGAGRIATTAGTFAQAAQERSAAQGGPQAAAEAPAAATPPIAPPDGQTAPDGATGAPAAATEEPVAPAPTTSLLPTVAQAEQEGAKALPVTEEDAADDVAETVADEPVSDQQTPQIETENGPEPFSEKRWSFTVGGRTQERITIDSRKKDLMENDPTLTEEQAAGSARRLSMNDVSGIEGIVYFNQHVDDIFRGEREDDSIRHYHLHGDEMGQVASFVDPEGVRHTFVAKPDINFFGAMNDTERLGHEWTDYLNTRFQKETQQFIQNDERWKSATTADEKAKAFYDVISDWKDVIGKLEIDVGDGKRVPLSVSVGIGANPESAETMLNQGKDTIGRNSIAVDKAVSAQYNNNIHDSQGRDLIVDYWDAGLRSDKLEKAYNELSEEEREARRKGVVQGEGVSKLLQGVSDGGEGAGKGKSGKASSSVAAPKTPPAAPKKVEAPKPSRLFDGSILSGYSVSTTAANLALSDEYKAMDDVGKRKALQTERSRVTKLLSDKTLTGQDKRMLQDLYKKIGTAMKPFRGQGQEQRARREVNAKAEYLTTGKASNAQARELDSGIKDTLEQINDDALGKILKGKYGEQSVKSARAAINKGQKGGPAARAVRAVIAKELEYGRNPVESADVFNRDVGAVEEKRDTRRRRQEADAPGGRERRKPIDRRLEGETGAAFQKRKGKDGERTRGRRDVSGSQASEVAVATLGKNIAKRLGVPGSEVELVAQEAPSEKAATVAEAVANRFGKRVAWFTPTATTRDNVIDVPAVYDPAQPNIVFLNTEGHEGTGFVGSVGHELLHAMKNQSPDLYNIYAEVAAEERTAVGVQRLAYKAQEEGAERAEEELNAEFVGDEFTRESFWKRLYERSPEAFKVAVAELQKILDKIFKTKRTRISSAFYKDIERVRDTLAKVMAEYQGRQGEGNDGEPLAQRREEYGPEQVVGWEKDFPRVTSHVGSLRSLYNHESYDAAKAGNQLAAVDLAMDLVDEDAVRKLRRDYPDAIVVGVSAQEESGENAIPDAVAKVIAKLGGMDFDENIIQSNVVKHTGKGAAYRLLTRPEFSGEVEVGREYIIVDDVTATGSTLRELREYIESYGGNVVHATALVTAHSKALRTRGDVLAVTEETIERLRNRLTDEELRGILEDYDIAQTPQHLTNSQALYLATFKDVDHIRARFAKEAQKEHVGSGREDDGPQSVIAPQTSPEDISFQRRDRTPAQVAAETPIDGAEGTTQFQEAPAVETEEFKAWFGDSKVVNEDGTPKVVYHGTDTWDDFGEFSKELLKDQDGFFFTSNPFMGASYAGSKRGARIMPVYVSLQNPLVIDGAEKGIHEVVSANTMKRARGAHDGVIVKNTTDPNYYSPLGDDVADVVVAFEPTQIKSATGNIGTFDAENPDIRFQKRSDRTPAQVAAETFYSPAVRGAENLKQEKGTPEQMLAMLKKQPGVKQVELDWLGVEAEFGDRKSVTKQELVDFMRENQVEIEETTKGKDTSRKAVFYSEDPRWGETAEFNTIEEAVEAAMEWGGTHQEAVDFVNETNDTDNLSFADETKYGSYTLPGGENYRELLLRMPSPDLDLVAERMRLAGRDRERPLTAEEQRRYDELQQQTAAFSSGHFDEPNIFAHVRMNDRTGPNGEKVLFIEEVQSDWARAAREKGVQVSPATAEAKSERLQELRAKGYGQRSVAEQEELNALVGEVTTENLKVPAQPFLKNWHETAMKRVLRMAAEEGYDRVAWISGAQTAERYDLSKRVDSILYQVIEDDDGSYTWSDGTKFEEIEVTVFVNGMESLKQSGTPDVLNGVVGKSVVDKMLAGAGKENEEILSSDGYALPIDGNVLSGDDLKTTTAGAPWTANLYDRMLPKFLNKYSKKWGAKVEPVVLGVGGENAFVNRNDSHPMPWEVHGEGGLISRHATAEEARTAKDQANLDQAKGTQQSIPITPEMRQSVMEGQPLFQKRPKESPIVDEAPEVAAGVAPETKRDFLLRMVHDKHRRLLKIQRALKPEGVDEAQDTYLREEMISGRTEARLNEFEKRFVIPLQKMLAKAKVTLEELEDYVYAKHAPERNAHIAEINPEFAEKNIAGSGMNNETAAAIIAQAKEEGKVEELEAMAKLVYGMSEIERGVRLEGGLISAEEKAAWEKYEYYVSLRGIDEEESTQRTGRGFDVRGKESKRALGRKSKARNILAHTIMQASEAVIRAEKNRVGQAFLEFVKANPDANLWEVDKVVLKPTYNKAKGEVVYAVDQRYQLADNVMSVKVDGQEFHITIHDPALAAGMKNLGASKSNWLLQAMGTFNRYLAMVNTSWSIGFLPTNFARDLQTAMINASGMEGMSAKESLGLAKSILKNIPNAAKGVYQGMNDKQGKFADWYREYEQVGGKVGFFGLKDVDQIQKELTNSVRDLKPGVPATARRMFKATVDFVTDANAIVENSTRLSTYIAMRERGMSSQRAASVAKNMTVNFNRKGELGSLINALYIFSNASIQGTARLAQALKSPRTQAVVAGIGVAAFMNAQLMRTLGGNDPDDDEPYYDKIPDWVKQNNIIIMLPATKGKYIKIPVPYGYNVFWAVGQAIDKAVSHPTKRGALEGASMIGGAIAQSFNPMGDAPTLMQGITPTFLRPVADLYLNKNFAGNPIMREDKFGPAKSRAHTFGKGTSEQSKAVTQALNQITGGSKYQPGLVDIHPDLADYLVEFAAGGFGRTVSQVVSGAAKISTNKPLPVREIPVIRRFVAEQYDYQAQSTFYDYQERVAKIRAEYNDYVDTNPAKAREFGKKNAMALSLSKKKPLTVRDKSGKSRKTETTMANVQQREMRDLREKIKSAEEHNNQKAADMYGDLLIKKVKGYNKLLRSIKELN